VKKTGCCGASPLSSLSPASVLDMEERTSGIILRTRPLTETSLVVHWLTPDLGRLSTVAKGARRPKSPFLGKLDLFYAADFSFARSRRSDLHNLREVIVRDSHAALRKDIARLNEASYFVILIEKGTEPEAPIPELHELMLHALAHLTTNAPAPATVFVFELKILCVLGYEPVLDSLPAAIRGPASSATYDSFANSVGELSRLKPEENAALNRFLQRSIGSALEKVPAQRDRALAS
jgi:DNA repair protein RecO (recombination protein O)